jgi:hypothetical protein
VPRKRPVLFWFINHSINKWAKKVSGFEEEILMFLKIFVTWTIDNIKENIFRQDIGEYSL